MPRLPLSGSLLQKEIIGRAHELGWRAAHFMAVQDIRGVWRTPAGADGKGFPDLVLVRDRLVMAEVKGDKEGLYVEQKTWAEWLEEAGIEHHVWRPKHWFDGTIDKVLA